jgi:hypothetical protein
VSDHPADNRLLVPVVGPWLTLMERATCEPPGDVRCDEPTGGGKMFLILDGVFQAAGEVTLVVGVMKPRREKVMKIGVVDVAPASLGRGTPGVMVMGRW